MNVPVTLRCNGFGCHETRHATAVMAAPGQLRLPEPPTDWSIIVGVLGQNQYTYCGICAPKLTLKDRNNLP